MTDRSIRTPADLEDLRFDAAGLVPVVAQDARSGAVLMVAWANREALEETLATGLLHFHSRSRGRLWRKGESSGNTLRLGSLHADCDRDTLLAHVFPAGPACHTGEPSCFGSASAPPGSSLDRLDDLLEQRARERPEGSYTVRLLSDENLRLKKLGEELAEVLAALAAHRGEEAAEEAADLVYHLMVALRGAGIPFAEVARILEMRGA